MYENSYPTICSQANSAFEVRQLMEYIGWFPEKIVRNGDVYLAYCPIHKDRVFRTLVLNPRNNTYHCTHVNCPGHRSSDFLDLLVRVSGTSLPEVIQAAADHFGADHFRLTRKQLEILGQLVAQARGEPPPPSAPARPGITDEDLLSPH